MTPEQFSVNQDHEFLANDLRDTTGSFLDIPSRLTRMLSAGSWRKITRACDNQTFEHHSVEEWICAPRWSGLATNLSTIIAVCENSPEYATYGLQAISLLKEALGDRFEILLGQDEIERTPKLVKQGRPVNVKNDVKTSAPQRGSTGRQYVIARLRRDADGGNVKAAELLPLVLSRKLSCVQASVQMGWKRPANNLDVARKAILALSDEEVILLVRERGLSITL